MGCFTSCEYTDNANCSDNKKDKHKKGASSKCCFTSREYTDNANCSDNKKCCSNRIPTNDDNINKKDTHKKDKHKKGAFSKCYCLKRIPE